MNDSTKLPLMNAKEQAEKHPKTFLRVPLEEILKLEIGDHVKLCFWILCENDEALTGERMWVKITEIKGPNYIGLLMNEPDVIDYIKYGDVVHFCMDNILNCENY